VISKKTLFKILLALGVTVLFLLVLYRLQKISLHELWQLFTQASPRFLLLGLAAVLLANIIRGFRFHLLLRRRSTFRDLFASNNVYNLTTATFPGGLGEIFSVFIFQRYGALNTGAAFSIIALSRLFDLLSLSLLLMIALCFCSCTLARLLLGTSSLLAVLAFFLLIPRINRFLVARLIALLPSRPALQRPAKFLQEIQVALAYVQDVREWLILFGLSGVMMTLNILSLLMLLFAAGLEASFGQATVAFGVYAILQLFPLHGLGGVGTQEAWWTLGLTSVGFPKEIAVPVSFFLHGMFYLYILLIALFFGFPWLRREHPSEVKDGVLLPK